MSDESVDGGTFTRVCRRCSAQSTTNSANGPACGKPFVRSRRPSRRVAMIGGAVALLIGAGATGLIVKDQRDRDRAAAAEQAAVEREEAEAAAAAEEQTAEDEAERTLRSSMVEQLEESITKHAKELVDDDLLDGPILYSSCTAVGGSTDDLTALTGTFDCLAVNEERGDGTARGYSYNGTADWTSGEISWQLGN